MAKPTFLVMVSREGCEREFDALWERLRSTADRAMADEMERVGFVEAVRASNRREAMVLVRARYPGHRIASRIVRQVQA
jgi:hypothetical protein